MNHRQLAESVLRSVGGQSNINKVSHCVTRLRFELKDNKLPDTDEIKQMDGVITVIQQGGQYQVVIGNQVVPVFNELKAFIGDKAVQESETDLEAPAQKKTLFERFTTMISGIFMPIMGAFAASGIIKGLLACLSAFGVLTATDGTYIVLNAIGDTVFYFFPVFIGGSAAKYFGLNQYLGMMIGGALVYPSLIGFVGAEQKLTFLSLPINMVNYSSSVFPAIVTVWFASVLYRWIDKGVPSGFKYFLTPLIVSLVTVPLTLFIIGPSITYLSNGLAQLTTIVYDFSPILAGLLLGGPWILIVMFGLHWAFVPIFVNNMMTLGYDPIMGLLVANQFAMAGAAFAYGLRITDKKQKSLGISTGGTALLGVSEPALYGVLLPNKKPLIMAIIAGSLGGVIGGAMLAKVYAFVPSGVFAITGVINPAGIDIGFYGYLLEMVVGLILGFVLTYIWGMNKKTKQMDEVTSQSSNTSERPAMTDAPITVYSPLSGRVVNLSEVADEAFSSEAMGKGFAIIPSNGTVVSPVNGVIATLTKSKHAIAIIGDQGQEILIHIGLDTVKMKGEGFTPKVKEGDVVNTGDILMEVDLAKINEHGLELITPVIITNSSSFSSIISSVSPTEREIVTGAPLMSLKI
ncbi:beta-glucoside-specific PTS transporter subunit IIABC [Paenibacillus illinoisensis]|uniref:beta-glucoside-specific PTS transporter subunit IIABC n=1 Tax=Paenibacillus illinoisensis TaxID=59845 RepID=UPI0034C4AE74